MQLQGVVNDPDHSTHNTLCTINAFHSHLIVYLPQQLMEDGLVCLEPTA